MSLYSRKDVATVYRKVQVERGFPAEFSEATHDQSLRYDDDAEKSAIRVQLGENPVTVILETCTLSFNKALTLGIDQVELSQGSCTLREEISKNW